MRGGGFGQPSRLPLHRRAMIPITESCSAVEFQAVNPAQTPGPVNLKVLPKDISGGNIRALMHDYTKAIGAPCGYCYEENAQGKSIDLTSDANPMKQTARLMIRMTNDINAKYLGQLGDRRYAEPFTCGNCHQGHTSPPVFEPKP